MSGFDYDSPGVPATAVADVVADIASHGKLPPLSDEEREQRRVEHELYRWECQRREEQRAFEYRQQQAEQAAEAKRQAAIAAEAARQKAQREMRERDRERQREQQLVGLHIRAKQHELWQSNVEAAARNAMAVRQRQALISELERSLTPPPPEPEPTVVYVEPEEERGICGIKPVRWR